MNRVFVDTAAWIALLDATDGLHASARRVHADLSRERAPLVTSEFVLLEVADALSSPSVRMETVKFLRGLRLRKTVRIVPADSALFAKGWDLYSRRPDKEWGLTDCISFALMGEEQLMRAFTFDHHFEQAGFVVLPAPR